MIDKIVKGLKLLVGLGAAGFALSAVADEAGTAKWNAMAAHYRIDFPKVDINEGVTIANFPMPVRLGNAWSENNGFSIKGLDVAANQIRFFVAEIPGGGYKEVPFEVECWEKEKDRALVWVKIPEVVSRQTLYLGVMATGSDEGLLPSKDVWKDYYAVWHMNDTAVNVDNNASDGVKDSSDNDRDAVIVRDSGSNMESVDTALGKGVRSGTYNQRVFYKVAAKNMKALKGTKVFSIETIASCENGLTNKFDKLISWRSDTKGKYIIAQQLRNHSDGVRVDLMGRKKDDASTYVNWQGFQTRDTYSMLISTNGTPFFAGFIANESGRMTNIVDTTIAEEDFKNENKKNAEDGSLFTDSWNGIGDGLTDSQINDFQICGRSGSSANWMGVVDEVRIAKVARSAEFMRLVRDSAVGNANEWSQMIASADAVRSILSLRQVGVSCAKISYSLSGVAGAGKTLQLSASESFETIVDSRVLSGSDSEYLIDGLTPGATYYARVKAEAASLPEPVFSLPIEINLISTQIALSDCGFIWRGDLPSFMAAFSGDDRLNYSAQLLVGDEVKKTIETVTQDAGIMFLNEDIGEVGDADSATIKLIAVSPIAEEEFSTDCTASIDIVAGALSGVLRPEALKDGYFFIGETVNLIELPEGMRYNFVNAYGVDVGNDGRSFIGRIASPFGVEVKGNGNTQQYGVVILPNKREDSDGDVWVRELMDGYDPGTSTITVTAKTAKWRCVTNPSRHKVEVFPGMKSDKVMTSGHDIAVVFDRGLRNTGWVNFSFTRQMHLDEFYYFNVSPSSTISPKMYENKSSEIYDTGLVFDTSDGKPGLFVYDAIWKDATGYFGSTERKLRIVAPSGLDMYFSREDLGDTTGGRIYEKSENLYLEVPEGKAITVKTGKGTAWFGSNPEKKSRFTLCGGGVFRNETTMKFGITVLSAESMNFSDDSVIESVGCGASTDKGRAGIMVKKELHYEKVTDEITNSVYYTEMSPTAILAARGHADSIVPNVLDDRYPDYADAMGSISVGTQREGEGAKNFAIKNENGEVVGNSTDNIGNRLDSVKKIILDGGLLSVYGERVAANDAWPEANRLLTTTVNELELMPGFSIFNVGGDFTEWGATNDVHVAQVTHADGAFLTAYSARLMRKASKDNGRLTFDGVSAAMPWLFVYDETYGLLPATVAADGMVGPANVDSPIAVTGGNVFKQGDAVAVSATGDCTVGAGEVALNFAGHGYMTFTSAAADLANTVTVSQPVTAPAGLALAAPCAADGKVVLGGNQRGVGGNGITLAIGKFELNGLKMRGPLTVVGGATEATFSGDFKSDSTLSLVSAGITKPKVDPGAGEVKVRYLTIDGVTMEDGTYGSPESEAQNKSEFFTGTGVVTVDHSFNMSGAFIIVR